MAKEKLKCPDGRIYRGGFRNGKHFMAKERRRTQMEEFTKESGKIVSHGMAKERISTQMEEFTKERL